MEREASWLNNNGFNITYTSLGKHIHDIHIYLYWRKQAVELSEKGSTRNSWTLEMEYKTNILDFYSSLRQL